MYSGKGKFQKSFFLTKYFEFAIIIKPVKMLV